MITLAKKLIPNAYCRDGNHYVFYKDLNKQVTNLEGYNVCKTCEARLEYKILNYK